jgi:hypothetical protein
MVIPLWASGSPIVLESLAVLMPRDDHVGVTNVNVDVVDVAIRDNHVSVVEPWIWLVLKADTDVDLAETGLLLLAVAGQQLSESDDGFVARKTAGSACSSLMLAG